MPWSRSSRRAAVSIEKELQLNEFSSPLRSPGGRQFVATTGSPMMESLGDRPARLLAPTDEDPRDSSRVPREVPSVAPPTVSLAERSRACSYFWPGITRPWSSDPQ